MDSKQRYTEEIRPYDFDVDFLESLRAFDKQISVRVVMALEDNEEIYPDDYLDFILEEKILIDLT